jgi:cytochrome c oxidase cbb3-type subunit 3
MARPPRRSRRSRPITRTNEDLYKAIKEGGAGVGKSNLMPAWGATLKDEQISDVVAYVRSLATPPYEGPK